MENLYNVDSPIDRGGRKNLNDTFADILRRFNNLQMQINILSGDSSVEDVLTELTKAIDNANVTIEDVQAMAELYEAKLTEIEDVITNANNATSETIGAIYDAREAIKDINNLIASMRYKGEYDSSSNYYPNNIVRYGKNSYVSLKEQQNVPPDDDGVNWQLIAMGGIDGTGAVSTVNTVAPDEFGNVDLDVPSRKEFIEMENTIATHFLETERNYNLAMYMRDEKTPIQAFQQILAEIGNNGIRAIVYIPAGYYDFTEITTSFSLPSQITILGDGNNSSVLLVKNNELFSIGSEEAFVNNIMFKDINFMSLNAPNSNQVCVGVRNGGDIVFDNVQFSNVATILIGGTVDLPCHSVRFMNIKGYLNNLGRPAFLLFNGTGLFLEGSLFVNGTNTPTHGESMNTEIGTDLISLQGNWDTIEVKGIYERFYRVLYGVTNGKIIQNITLEGVFDYIRQSCIDMKTNNTAGAITGVKVVDSWIFCWEGDAIRIINTPNAIVRNISVSNCDIACAGIFGIHMLNIKSFLISNNRISGIGQVDGNNNGIFITEANSDFVIEGNILTYAPNTGINWGNAPWIYVSAESDKYNITNNHAYGYLIMQPTNPNSNRLVTTNTRWGNELDLMYDKNYSLPLPDDNVNFINPYPFILDIYVFGSITSVHKNNIQIAGVTESANINIKLYPGESIKLKRNGTINWTIFGLS